MNYLIIALVVILVMSPVFWMMPSPGQKRQIRLRQRAMDLGLQVKICDLPQTRRAEVRREPKQQGVVYRLPRKQLNKPRETFYHLVTRADSEADTDDKYEGILSLLKKFLVTLPAQVLALEYTNSGVAIYWREQGTIELVEQIHQSLQLLDVQLNNLD